LISPRELQMMALLVVSHINENPYASAILAARHHVYLLAKPLVPETHLAAFDQQFSDPWPDVTVNRMPKDFVLTPTRFPLYQLLEDLMALRVYRRNTDYLNEAQLYGGLGGIVI